MRPPIAEAVCFTVCEDVRHESSGRISLMGVYGPSIEVEKLPVLVQALCAVLSIRNPGEELKSVTTAILDPSGKPVLPPSVREIGPSTIGPKYALNCEVKVAPFPIVAEGDITFRFTFNGDDQVGVEIPITVRVRAKTVSPQ